MLEMLRQGIMADPRWMGGNYAADAPPEQGMRLWAGWLSGVITRMPGFQESLYLNAKDAVAYLKGVEDAGWKRMDATDWRAAHILSAQKILLGPETQSLASFVLPRRLGIPAITSSARSARDVAAPARCSATFPAG